jgi:serine/threonine-protein kinase HipA
MIDFSTRVKRLTVRVDSGAGGELIRESQYRFSYDDAATAPVSLIMPLADRQYVDNDLFAAMDMNLPEGFLLAQIRERAPKSPPTKMHLLALMGENGIGRLSYQSPGRGPARMPEGISRARLLEGGAGPDGALFADLVDAFLATGSGLAGVQPKIVVPERGTFPIPNLIVKSSGRSYPGLVANEFLCLEVARLAGIPVPPHALSADGELLLIDRFDLEPGGGRLGFEDVAALADLRVGGALSDRKYRGSYEDVVSILGDVCTDPQRARAGFFDGLALAVVLRNGDGHLKNFGVLYDADRVWLSPLYDLVTTTVYPYERANGVRVTDRTMALKLRRADRQRPYPTREELLRFGREVCGVAAPEVRLERVLDAMREVLETAPLKARVPTSIRGALAQEWEQSDFFYRAGGR